MDRRALIRLAWGAAAGLLPVSPSGAQPRLDGEPFRLGVASGSPTATGVVLWTRLMGLARGGLFSPAADVTVRWEIADDPAFKTIVRSGQSQALADLAHSVHVEVDGLAPERWYHYRFMVGDALSPVGRTRTLPAADARVARLRLAYASCQKWEDGYYAAWRHLREESPDFIAFLGDYIYEYPGTGSRVRVPTGGWVVTLDDYRQRYALYRSDPDLRAAHEACPWLLTWDDHEVQNDHAGLLAGNSGPRDPALPGEFPARRAAAYQAYFEHMPLRASAWARAVAGGSLRLYDRLQFGRLVNLRLLDDRQYRDPQACTRDGQRGASTVNPATCPIWNDPARTLLGAEQERWLEQGFGERESAESRWNVLAQQTAFGRRDFRPGPGESFSNDGWDGYPAARARVLAGLQKHRVPGVVVLGGDVHANWVGHVKADYAKPASQTLGVEFCGTSISSHGGNNERAAERLAENPHFVLTDSEQRGYGLVDFSDQRLETALRVVDDPARRDSGVRTLARFGVSRDAMMLERQG